MFDPATRVGVAASTIGFSDALAGRGSDINDAIGAFEPLVTDLGPVARNLASPKTDFGGFLRGLESFSRALVPVAKDQADLYSNLDTTFTALSTVAVPFLQEWISPTPPTFQSVIADEPPAAVVRQRHRRAVRASCDPGSRRSRRAPRCSPTRSRPARATCPARSRSTSA